MLWYLKYHRLTVVQNRQCPSTYECSMSPDCDVIPWEVNIFDLIYREPKVDFQVLTGIAYRLSMPTK